MTGLAPHDQVSLSANKNAPLSSLRASMCSAQEPEERIGDAVRETNITQRFRYAETLVAAKRVAEAIQLLEDLLEAEPNNKAILRLLGRAYLAGGRSREAARVLEKALGISRTTPREQKPVETNRPNTGVEVSQSDLDYWADVGRSLSTPRFGATIAADAPHERAIGSSNVSGNPEADAKGPLNSAPDCPPAPEVERIPGLDSAAGHDGENQVPSLPEEAGKLAFGGEAGEAWAAPDKGADESTDGPTAQTGDLMEAPESRRVVHDDAPESRNSFADLSTDEEPLDSGHEFSDEGDSESLDEERLDDDWSGDGNFSIYDFEAERLSQQRDIDEIDPYLVDIQDIVDGPVAKQPDEGSDDRISRSGRARQIAMAFAEEHGWDWSHVPELENLFEEYGWSSAKTALERAIHRGLVPEQLQDIRALREYWSDCDQFWIEFRFRERASAVYRSLSWPLAQAICCSGHHDDDLEDHVMRLEQWYEDWYTNSRLRREFSSFMAYLSFLLSGSRAVLPANIAASFPPLDALEFENVSDRGVAGSHEVRARHQLDHFGVPRPVAETRKIVASGEPDPDRIEAMHMLRNHKSGARVEEKKGANRIRNTRRPRSNANRARNLNTSEHGNAVADSDASIAVPATVAPHRSLHVAAQ